MALLTKLKKQGSHSTTAQPSDQLDYCLATASAEKHSSKLPKPLQLSLSRHPETPASAKPQSGPSLEACLLLSLHFHVPAGPQVGKDFPPTTTHIQIQGHSKINEFTHLNENGNEIILECNRQKK